MTVRVFIDDFTVEKLQAVTEAIECAMHKKAPLQLMICSPGGSVYTAFAMIDLIRSSPVAVSTVGLGAAMSAGGLLLAAGAKGLRFVSKRTTVMVHEVQSMSEGQQSAREVENDATETQRLNNEVCFFLDTMTGKRKGTWLRRLRKKGQDLFLTAEEAVAEGLADQVGIPWVNARAAEHDISLLAD